MRIPFRHTVDLSERLDVFLSRASSQSRAFIQAQIAAGNVNVNGERAAKASRKLRPGDVVSGELAPEEPLDLAPVRGDLAILHEDESLLVLNKAQGIVVHPAAGHRGETLVHHLLHHFQSAPEFLETSPTRPGIVHRLDRGTSGVLLVAKSRAVHEALSKAFKLRHIKKEYEAIAWGVMKEKGVFESTIGRDPKNRKKMSSRAPEGREALTRWARARAFRHFTHVALFPHTGRTHQLRVHLSEARHPIVGDELYGRAPRGLALPAPLEEALRGATETFLHAKRLELAHPVTGKPLVFTAPRPERFENLLSLLERWDAA